MIRFIVRAVGLALLAAAFAAAVVDGTRSIASGAVWLTPFGEAFYYLFPHQFILIRPWVEGRIGRWAWDPVLVDLFKLPTWLVLGAVGMALIGASKKPAAKIGYLSRP